MAPAILLEGLRPVYHIPTMNFPEYGSPENVKLANERAAAIAKRAKEEHLAFEQEEQRKEDRLNRIEQKLDRLLAWTSLFECGVVSDGKFYGKTSGDPIEFPKGHHGAL